MIKEVKYFFFIIVIFVFIFFTSRYYFSDENIKKSYRSVDNINLKIDKYSSNLLILKNDTENIIEYVDENENKKKKKYFFWNLLNDEK
tara:strand:+ start:761 stop:1024 length:264 start_codon:yes stop_codon:yes gene_type:complete